MKYQPDSLYYGDCLDVMREWPAACVDLCYLDPPYGPGTPFADAWRGTVPESIPELDMLFVFARRVAPPMHEYLGYMAVRLLEMRRVLRPTGSIYLHCDPTASHYLKVIMDAVFGTSNFQNEFIWYYSGGGASKSRWARKHDVILFYTKSATWTFNVDAVRTPYKWTNDQKRADGSRRNYENGKLPDDVWEHHAIMPWAKERLGYPTQKPRALLRRIVEASSNAGDMVLDPFCGSGTTVVTAQKLNRRFVGIDRSHEAIEMARGRLDGRARTQRRPLHSDA